MTYQELQTEAQSIISNIKQVYSGPGSDVDRFTTIREWGDNGVSIIVANASDTSRKNRFYEGRITTLRRKVNWKKIAKAVEAAALTLE